MAILAYDDLLLREPRLLVPGQQPLSPVKLNPDVRWVTNIRAGFFGHNLQDYNYKELPSWESTVPAVLIAGTKGFGPFPTVTASYISQIYEVISGYPHTVGVRVYLKSAAADGCILSVSNSGGTSRLQLDYASGAIRGIHVNSAGSLGTTSLPVTAGTGNWISAVFVGISSTNRRLFIDSRVNINTTTILISGWDSTTFGFLNKAADSLPLVDGYIADPVFLDVALSNAEAQSWAADYYKFMIPA